ncbi:MAG: hypothetical protein ABI977_30860 [Acidobacteriota bacterium]
MREYVVYAGEYAQVCNFLDEQHAPRRHPTPEEIEEANKQLADLERMSLDRLPESGMFKFILGPKPDQQERCQELIQWLDEYITEELIHSYAARLKLASLMLSIIWIASDKGLSTVAKSTPHRG